MKSEKYRKSVFVVTYAKTRKGIEYLLLKRKLHWIGWEFPKGGRRIYETKKGTVKREIKEETGLKIIKGKIKKFDIEGRSKFDIEGRFKYEKKYPDRKSFVGQSYSLYSAEVKKPLKGEIRIDKREHSDYKWVSFKEAIKNLRWPNQKNCLKIVNSKIKLD